MNIKVTLVLFFGKFVSQNVSIQRTIRLYKLGFDKHIMYMLAFNLKKTLNTYLKLEICVGEFWPFF